MSRKNTDWLRACLAVIAASSIATVCGAQVVSNQPFASTETFTLAPSRAAATAETSESKAFPAPSVAPSEIRVYPDTSLTACPSGEKLRYFFYYQDIPDLRGSSWCGAAEASNEWANRNDPVRWRVPYRLESCQAGVSWYYSHAYPDGTRYYSPAFRGITMVCEPDTCPVAPLGPILDSAAMDHEAGRYATGPDMINVNERVRSGTACIIHAAAALGASAEPTSGFRPPAYQTHLRELWDKWHQLRSNSDESCRETKQQVAAEWVKHQLIRRPVSSSAHSTGNAVDIRGVPPEAADAIAAQCGMFRPEPVTDRVHFQPR